MLIHQFENTFLSHFSYAVVHQGKMALIDPSRDPEPYYQFAEEQGARIVAVIETHLHADFVSSHMEISRSTGAPIFIHPAARPEFDFHAFDEGSAPLQLGDMFLKALYTPGHSPDSICILLRDEKEKPLAVFTGDTLFSGDVGRPDLRETTFTRGATREKLARELFHSLHQKLMVLPGDVMVYPAHGAGTLCGKNLSATTSSTIGRERTGNYALQIKEEKQFVQWLLEGQPPAPKYFSHAVERNRKSSTADFKKAVEAAGKFLERREEGVTVVDSRSIREYREGHIPGSINIPDDTKFETWLGTVIAPEELFCLVGKDNDSLLRLTGRIITIGYESNLKGWLHLSVSGDLRQNEPLDLADFIRRPGNYTIVDIRSDSEVKRQKIFDHSLAIPLPVLRENVGRIPGDRPVVVHCGGTYRSAVAASILDAGNLFVYDLGDHIKKFFPSSTTSP